MRSSTRFLLASQLLGAAVGLPGGSSPVETRAEAKTYDYVIVGGGLTGLVVANRLTEDKSSEYLLPGHEHHRGWSIEVDLVSQKLFSSSKREVLMTTPTSGCPMAPHSL